MIHLVGIGPGDPELLTIKAARLLGEADIIYVPQSNYEGRSVSDGIIAPHANPDKIRHVAISMRSPERGTDPAYARLAEEMAEHGLHGRRIVYVSLGDTLLYSTAQYLGRELDTLGVPHAYVPGIPSFTAAASYGRVPLAAGREGLVVHVMPDSLEKLAELASCCDTMALLKVNKRMPVLMEYIRRHSPARAVLLHRIGLDNEAAYELTASSETPEDVGYLSIAIIRQR